MTLFYTRTTVFSPQTRKKVNIIIIDHVFSMITSKSAVCESSFPKKIEYDG